MEKIEDVLNSLESVEKENQRNALRKYIGKWYWFALFCSIGLFLGFLLFKYTPQSYKVQSRLLIPIVDNSINGIRPFNSQAYQKELKTENQIGILQSFTLYKEALENLNWQVSFFKKEGLNLIELYGNEPFEVKIPDNAKNLKSVKLLITALNDKEFKISADDQFYQDGIKQELNFNKNGNFNAIFSISNFEFILNKRNCIIGKTYYMVFNDINLLTQKYLKDVKIALEDKKSELISVQLIDPNPEKSAVFINELNRVFISYGLKQKNQVSESSINFIDTTLLGISNTLKSAEVNLSNYRKENKSVDLGSEAKLINEKLEQIENEKYLAKIRIDYYKNLQAYMGDAKKIKQMINPSITGIADANLNGLLSKLMDFYSKREVLSYTVEANNPSLILLEKEIQLASNAILENLNNLLKNAEVEMENMKSRYADVLIRLTKLPDTERRLVSIQRDFNLNNELYTYMMQKKAEAAITLASNIPQVQIIDPAMVEASVKVGRNPYIYILGGFALGFLIPFLFIFINDIFNTKIESVEEVEKLTKIPIIEGIIHSRYKDGLPTIKNPNSGIAESFRLLKTNLRNMIENPNQYSVSINSMVPGEGKSFISSNFAAILSLSASDKKVLLIEGDLRKPRLSNLFGNNDNVGLSSYLQNKSEFREIIIRTPTPNLFFMPSGEIPSNPNELLETDRFRKLIEKAKAEFDYVIFDNAPVALVPDGLITSQHVNLNIFIIRLNYTRKYELKELNKTIAVNNIKNAVIIINDTNKKSYGYGNKYWKNGYGNYVKMTKTA